MPGTNGGTGYPVSLRCSKCRKSGVFAGSGFNLKATGRTWVARKRGIRQTDRKIQYRCQDCGHVGWTQHVDAERLLRGLK